MDKIQKKVEKYLKEEFPKKKLLKSVSIFKGEVEIYGIDSIQILVLEQPEYVIYQIVKFKN